MNIFRRISSIIIPTVYDDALSYMEMVRKIGAKINDVVDWINSTKFVHTLNGKSGDIQLGKIRFTGYVDEEYTGDRNINIRIPTGVGPNELGTLKIQKQNGQFWAYDGSESLTVPAGGVEKVNGYTGEVVLDAVDVGAIPSSKEATGIKNPMALRIIQGNTFVDYDGSQNVQITIPQGGGTPGGGAVDSVNGKTGVVVLTANDVGALPNTTAYLPNPFSLTIFDPNSSTSYNYDGTENKFIALPQVTGGGGSGGVTSVNGQTGAVQITPQNIGALSTAYIDTGIKNPNPLTIVIDSTTSQTYDGSSPVTINLTSGGTPVTGVTSVNGKTGVVTITLAELGGVSTSGKLANPQVINFSGYSTVQYDGSSQANVTIPNKIKSGNAITQTAYSGSEVCALPLSQGVHIIKIQCTASFIYSSIEGATELMTINISNTVHYLVINVTTMGSPVINFFNALTGTATVTCYPLILGV